MSEGIDRQRPSADLCLDCGSSIAAEASRSGSRDRSDDPIRVDSSYSKIDSIAKVQPASFVENETRRSIEQSGGGGPSVSCEAGLARSGVDSDSLSSIKRLEGGMSSD